jgi:molecular chaperone Hsp33
MIDDASAEGQVQRFLFEELDIRGSLVRLRRAWQQMIAGRGYAEPVRRLLGEMTAVAVLVGCNLKHRGRLTFQAKGDGPVSLLVIDCSAELKIRGMAHSVRDLPSGPAGALLGDGRLALVLDGDASQQPYQSIVPLQGESIAAIFEHYLAQSEQQPARLWLSASEQVAAGLFLQKLPDADARDPDGWNRLERLAGTLTPAELEALPAEALLSRLFPEEVLRVFKPQRVAYDCPEDWDKVRSMLRAIGRYEVESILREKGEVVVHDDICNREYRFDVRAVEALFSDAAGQTPRTLH